MPQLHWQSTRSRPNLCRRYMIRVTYNITPCAIASLSSADPSWFEAFNLAMAAELLEVGELLAPR